MIKSIVFDCDGTLVNTSFVIGLYFDTYVKMFKNEKFKKYEDFIPVYFLTNKVAREYFEIPIKEIEKFEEELEKEFKKSSNNLKLYQGISKMLEYLIKKDIYLGINTSRTVDGWESMKDIIGKEIFSQFKLVVTNEKVKKPKPHPESMDYYIKQTQYKKDQILFIGDSIYDYECAIQSGVKFGVAGWGVHKTFDWKDSIYFSKPEEVVKYIEEQERYE